MPAENKKTESTAYAELSYLWDAMGDAQKQAGDANRHFTNNLKEMENLKSRINHLNGLIREKNEKETALKAEMEALNLKINRDEKITREAENLISRFSSAQEKILSLTDKVAQGERKSNLSGIAISEFKAEMRSAKTILNEKNATITDLECKIKGLLALPEISNIIKSNTQNGKENLIENLSKNFVKANLEKKLLSVKTEKLKKTAEDLQKHIEDLRLKNSAIEKKLKSTSAELQNGFNKLKEKNAEIYAGKNSKNELLDSFGALKNKYENFKRDMDILAQDKKDIDKKLEEKTKETLNLKLRIKDSDLNIEKEKTNFADAVKKVFHLQSKLNEMRHALSENIEANKHLSDSLEQKRLDMNRINAKLVESSLNVRHEREINLRLKNKLDLFKHEINEIKEKSLKEAEYSRNLFNKLNDKQNAIEFLKKQLNKMDSLESEFEDLKRKNRKMSSMIKQEQSDFTDKIIKMLNKLHSDLKIVNMRIPLSTRKMVSMPVKNLLTAVNLLKGWREYVDESAVMKEYINLRDIIEPMLAQWNKTFRLKKMKLIKRINSDARCKLNKEKIKLAFYQLIKNSYEAMPMGGSLTVTLNIDHDKKTAILKFEDTSRGINQNIMDNLYSPFNSTKKDHIGIGLVIVKKIAEVHGGEFSIMNKKERGTISQFVFPLAEDENIPKFEKEDKTTQNKERK